MASARAEYGARRDQRRARVGEIEALERRLSNARLAVFAAGLALVFAAWLLELSSAWLLVPAVAFVVLVVVHDRARRRGDRARRAEAHYAAGLARLDGTWPGTGNLRDDFAGRDHPYAADLDLFGRGSLFERICTARTGAGVDTLARWLLAPAAVDTVRARQRAVDDLRMRIDLREDLALAGEALQGEVDPQVLVAWGERRALVDDRTAARMRVVAWALAVANVAALFAWIVDWTDALPLAVTALVTWVASRFDRHFTTEVGIAIERPSRELAIVAAVLARLEREHFDAPRLVELRTELVHGPSAASTTIAQLVRRAEWFEAHKGQLFAPVAFLLRWSVLFGLAVEAWRRAHGRSIARWFAALGELEALCSLAAYAYERAGDPFPELVDGAPMIVGEAIGHPLLPADTCVRNPLRLDDTRRALVVSGSNMAGKSTYLRTIGVNVVLALAGAPVCAESLRLAPLRIGATLRVQDSLQDGTSRFFAEITRLRRVMDIADEGPGLLFLLDEILHGTNSHDRRIGAEAIVRNLLDRGAIGLVTTHDLALAVVTDDLPVHVDNVHFADRIVDGRLHFDYRLAPGMVRTSNALALMRAVGLRV
ncbi:MAG TPA: hypothetical protein VFG69_13900 [Nannocystaceae bacterium]|nr:hypothetical protein [Nannocystaceae bacterium]